MFRNISKRSALHLSEECFALFQIGYLLPRNTVYKNKINAMILMAQQAGLIDKINNDVRWSIQRSATGKLLQASSSNSLSQRVQEERQLTTADTEGMFLLMGIGYAMGGIALISELVGGITNRCRRIIRNARRLSTTVTSPRSSVSGGMPRTEDEQNAHDQRKVEHKIRNAKIMKYKHAFGRRIYTITKNAFKGFFTTNKEVNPNYPVKNANVVLESAVSFVDSTTPSSAKSNNISEQSPIASLRLQKEVVLAEVDIHNNSNNFDLDVQTHLDLFEKYLAEQADTQSESD